MASKGNKNYSAAIRQLTGLRDEFAEKAKKAGEEALQLESLARAKHRERDNYNGERVSVDRTLELLTRQMEGQKKGELAQQAVSSLRKSAASKFSGHEFIFLLDGSGSMMGEYFERSVEAARAVQGVLEEKGAKISTVLFGNHKEGPINLNDGSAVAAARNGALGTELAAAALLLPQAAGECARHVIIVTDGDDFVPEKTQKAFSALLQQDAGMSLDVLILTKYRSVPLNRVLEKITADFPGRAVAAQMDPKASVEAALSELIVLRVKKGKAPQAKSGPKP